MPKNIKPIWYGERGKLPPLGQKIMNEGYYKYNSEGEKIHVKRKEFEIKHNKDETVLFKYDGNNFIIEHE